MPDRESDPPAKLASEVFAEGADRVELDSDPNTESPHEIALQISFYGHLLDFEREVLEHMRRLAASSSKDLQRALQQSNIEPMEALIEQFEQRLSFWRQREAELRAN
ncbi:MAG: hypothetical protein DLM67_08710 [Candidatus Nephthysia bennettiae]|uniref:Uncharacterized protein n=1 Tax=Candidatus Nephthysia bennettiae TaxID=3127016 RepID=A0A934JXV1_9BACT|nr:hypothetical protein [Candidatus Dormibacteraeota bacterium]MBJ7612513.1 hypothetical protein [Candidatus Dormibacteraeota bacterium]PZR97132.1 MAG: hypothetical protein DLM67_08710 [Candidatus Dormibacteraeota bacterium]